MVKSCVVKPCALVPRAANCELLMAATAEVLKLLIANELINAMLDVMNCMSELDKPAALVPKAPNSSDVN